MTNELRQLAKDLKAFAKRCKEFKYTESALFAFPLLGLTSFAETSTTDKAIQNQRQEISTSIGDMRQQFRKIKTENDKLMSSHLNCNQVHHLNLLYTQLLCRKIKSEQKLQFMT